MESIKYDLNALYPSFSSSEFQNDLKKLEEDLKSYSQYVEENCMSYDDFDKKLEKLIKMDEAFTKLVGRIYPFISLTRSADTTNEEANKYLAKVQMILAEATLPFTKSSKFIGKYEYLEELMDKEPFINYQFYLSQIKKETKHLLSDEQEAIISKMRQTGSTAWSHLQSLLTSKLEVSVKLKDETKIMTISEVGNLMHSPDADTRKAAYLGIQDAYQKIDDSIAMSLSSIKGEVNFVSKLRGYETALDQSLDVSRTKKETLDAMISAMYEYLPYFHQYLKRKAKLLGHDGGIPIYDLYAPLGEVHKSYTIEEAKDFIIKNFKTFDDKLANLAKKAFENNWIDVYPRKGKVGGAFCSNVRSIKESRVLSNFNGNLTDVITLAHELGHAYHGECIFENNILNTSYPMPVAETASTFCETIVMNAIINASNDEEKLPLIESELQDHTAIICDILSRFIFEKEVFETRLDHPLNSKELQNIMRNAVKESYGDGLNHDYVNPFAWLNKPHYYSAGLSFYNWPYAFGLLFAKGLYAQYLKDNKTFIDNYDNLLKATGKMNVEDVAKQVNIDVTDINFWRSSLEIIKKNIELFLELTEEKIK
ncbi:M3 family oligoendopeptidase [Mycoplasmatota bacterium]|nr:M3 family oligoendopeptidase [Mycoplasmatota bacterium]